MERSTAELARKLSMIAILQQSVSKISFSQGELRPRCSEVDHHRNLCGTDVFKILYRNIMLAYRKQKTTKFRPSKRVHLDRKSTLFILLPLYTIFTNLHVLHVFKIIIIITIIIYNHFISFIIILFHLFLKFSFGEVGWTIKWPLERDNF